MAQITLETALKWINKAKSDKDSSDPIYQEAMELVFPDRSGYTRSNEGAKKATKNWDSTATNAVVRAANRLSNEWTPQFSPFVEVGLGAAAEAMDDDTFARSVGSTKDERKRQFEAVSKVLQAVLKGPGFATSANEFYLDWHFGEAAMIIMPSESNTTGPATFRAIPNSHFYAYEGPGGVHDRWFMWHELRASAITEEWKDAKLSEDLAKIVADTPDKIVKLVSVVYRDYDEKGQPYRYEVFHQVGRSTQRGARIVERLSRTSPIVSARYFKLAGENRGRGPVLVAMPDIRTMNKVVEMTLRSVALALMGVYTVTDGVEGEVAIKPLGMIKVRHNGGPNGPSLQRLDTPGRLDFGQVVMEKLQEAIRRTIGEGGLPPEAGPIRTATEFIQRAKELVADQAGGLGRLYGEFIIPMVQRVIDILEQKAILPSTGLTIDQFLVEVRMLSPLSRGEALQQVENIVKFVEMLKMLMGDQGVMYEMKIDKTTEMLGDLMEIPKALRTTPDKKKEMEKAAAAVASAQAGGDPQAAAQAVDQQGQQQ